jgi:uncharacterized protein (TIGR03066 family)
MNTLRMVVAAFVATGISSAVTAADKDDNKKLIVGKWEVSKADDGTVPVGASVEFAKDGKFKMMAKKDGQDENREGTYSVDADALTLVMKRDDGDRTVKITIKKLSASELAVEGPDGKNVTFKKK